MRELLDDPAAGYVSGMSKHAFEARVLPRLREADRGPGRSVADGKPYAVFMLAERAGRYRTDELARALARAADVDVMLKNSTPPLAALTAYVAEADRRGVRRSRIARERPQRREAARSRGPPGFGWEPMSILIYVSAWEIVSAWIWPPASPW